MNDTTVKIDLSTLQKLRYESTEPSLPFDLRVDIATSDDDLLEEKYRPATVKTWYSYVVNMGETKR